MDKFTGNADEWSGWVFNLKVCADAMDDDFGEAVHEVTKAEGDRGANCHRNGAVQAKQKVL